MRSVIYYRDRDIDHAFCSLLGRCVSVGTWLECNLINPTATGCEVGLSGAQQNRGAWISGSESGCRVRGTGTVTIPFYAADAVAIMIRGK